MLILQAGDRLKMAEMEPCRYEKKFNGCGVKQICNSMFRRRSFWSGRASSAGASPNSSMSSRKRRGVGDEAAYSDTEANFSAGSTAQLKAGGEKYVLSRSPLNPNAGPDPRSRYHVAEVNKPSPPLVTSSTNMVVPTKKVVSRNVPTLSGELEAILPEPRARGNLVRASSSNMMVFGHLGNIRQPVPTNGQLPAAAKENWKAVSSTGGGAKQGGVTGNVLRKEGHPKVNLCRVLSRRLEPVELKELGNEEFKKGKYNEALAYYDLAISMDPSKAAYRSNRSAALTGLGRLLEAVEDCKEAVKMEPGYHRAHHRLATLYLR